MGFGVRVWCLVVFHWAIIIGMDDFSDIQFLQQRYAAARNKYKPSRVRCLLLGEAPPSSLDRHFYFEDVKRQDSLFLEIMGVLYPEEKQQYLSSGRDTFMKSELLQRFSEDGFLLLDLLEVPGELLAGSLADAIPSLLNRLQKIIDKQTPIIMIKADVYDTCYLPLTAEGYNVVPLRIPFPGSGQQRVFRGKFKTALTSIKW